MTHFTFNRYLYVYMPLGINMNKRILAHLAKTIEILEEMLDDVLYDDETLITALYARDHVAEILEAVIE